MRRIMTWVLCLVVVCFAGTACADQWGLYGKMSQFLKRSGDYNDVMYPELSSGYSPKSPFSFFTVNKDDEYLLTVLRLNEQDAFEEVGRYPGALKDANGSRDKEFWKRSTEDGIHLESMWFDAGEEYDFVWNGREMVLRYANTGNVTMTLLDGGMGYMIGDGAEAVQWLNRPLLLAEFRLDKLPQSVGEAARQNVLRQCYPELLEIDQRVTLDLGKKKNLPVYAAPFNNAYRGADGKAVLSLRTPFDVLGVLEDGWTMVEYEITRSKRRIGFVQGLDVEVQELFLLGQPGWLARTVGVTDDPHATCRELAVLEAGAEVEVLGYLDAFWLCIQTEVNGQSVWGFVPADALLVSDESSR